MEGILTELKIELARAVADAAALQPEEVLPTLETPKNEFGDLSSRVAFLLAAREKKNPVQIAQELGQRLESRGIPHIDRIKTKGPYLNFYFSNSFYANALKKILKEKEKFGQGKKTGKKIMVEFFDANTHKGVHIGHIRNASLGEALCRVLERAGHKVIRANYQGDIGPHVAKCLWGYIHLYHEKAPDENRGTWLGKVYAEASQQIEGNPELEAQVKEIILKLYGKEKKIYALWKKTRQWCLDDLEKFYQEFDVHHDEFYFESQTEKIGKERVQELLRKGVVKEDQGAVIMDLKEENLGVAVLLTKEGYPLYHAKDIGLAQLKFDKYDLDKSIHVVGKEQELYFKQLFAIFQRMGFEKAARVSYHLIYELVMLPEGKMSSREGTMVLYEELKRKLLEMTQEEVKKRHEDWNPKERDEIALQIALGALKFSMVRRESNRVILFDWDEALQLEGDTGPYLQYAYVRTQGIVEKAKEKKVKAAPAKGYTFSPEEKKLIKRLVEFGENIEKSARDLAPNSMAHYLLELATEFNKFYTVSPVLTAEKKEEMESRLALVEASAVVLKNGLHLLNIPCPERM